jgi:hypothetical protein
MEFEKSIFRVHEKLLRGPRSKPFIAGIEKVFGVLSVFSLVNFLIFHYLYIDSNDILKSAIETQMRPFFYEEYNMTGEHTLPLNYTKDTGRFIYDNSTIDYWQVRNILGTNG